MPFLCYGVSEGYKVCKNSLTPKLPICNICRRVMYKEVSKIDITNGQKLGIKGTTVTWFIYYYLSLRQGLRNKMAPNISFYKYLMNRGIKQFLFIQKIIHTLNIIHVFSILFKHIATAVTNPTNILIKRIIQRTFLKKFFARLAETRIFQKKRLFLLVFYSKQN